LYFISDRDTSSFGTQLFVTEDTTYSSAEDRPLSVPQSVIPTLFGQARDQRLFLTVVGGNQGGRYEIQIYDLLGRLVLKSNVEMTADGQTLKGDLKLEDLPSGSYLVALHFRQTHLSTRFAVTR
jgi:hypothetical protein